MTRKRITRFGAVVLVSFLGYFVVRELGLSVTCAMTEIERIRDAGPAGLAIFLGVYALGTWAMLPASWLSGSSGFLYGALPGIALAWSASTLFGWMAFEVTRGRLRARFAGWIARRGSRFGAIDRMIERRGLVAVVLLRLSPLAPYNIINYLLGLTSVGRGTYLLGTMIGGIVPALVYGLVGSAVSDLATMNEAGRGNPIATAAVIGTTVIASVGLAVFVKRALEPSPPSTLPQAHPVGSAAPGSRG